MAKKKGKSSANKLFVILVLLAILGGGGFFGYNYFIKSKQFPGGKLAKVKLKEDLVRFTFDTLPKIYTGLVTLNNEVILIDDEIKRLNKIGKKFPKQKNIVTPEIKNWKTVRKNILSSLTNIEENIVTLYVSWSVNKETGQELIASKKDELQISVNAALETSKKFTDRLKAEEPKGFVQKIMAKFK